ncbi:hypothetical protein [Spirosoma pollinicola]|uniref:DUF4369 domain-containing protein n=1 Tax=Spirosoma pollinicola TaxID=2057025 RepID=A0A2K8ZAA2_9BACT|nr:hypothetical protein [Spirosoma pollinicola]AUD06794.1 hypothetical protein CWM47_36075 [Spirosoma pollinicola]
MERWLSRVVLSSLAIALLSPSYGQLGTGGVVSQDQKGNVFTTFLVSTTYTGKAISTIRYLGSPFLGTNVWHQGSLQFRNGHQLAGKLSYNLITGTIFFQTSDSLETYPVVPDEFILEGRKFIGISHNDLGIWQMAYYQVVYDGQTKLLRRYQERLQPISRSVYPMRMPSDEKFDGRYIISEEFYVKRVSNSPKLIQLTQESLRKALPDAPSDLLTSETTTDLTQAKLIALITAYDSRKLANY